jgi:protein O-mannosyl-transferase
VSRKRGRDRERASEPSKRLVPIFAVLLAVGTLALYSPVRGHDFIDYDDQDYVVKNPHVTSGLTWETIRWSITSTEAANWHPITWLSHALDCQLFELDAGDHHLMSAVIHTLAALLLFLLLQRITGASGRSFFVAALFAWHPFNVGSVAWIAERKNLVSTLFFFLTLGLYGWYALQPRMSRLAAVAGAFALALASKPMVVTLPFVLLLLDYWPLQRVAIMD